MLEATNIGCVRGGRRLFQDVSLAVRPGDLVQLMGPNGSGKTSLLRILCGLMPPTSGKVQWRGEDIRALGAEYVSAITYLGHRHGVKDELTALENLRVSAGLSGVEIDRNQASDVLARVGLAGREHLPARFLSEGQRRRLGLARLLVCQTSLWLLDEALASLDKAAVMSMTGLIQEHLARGGMAIVATHQELEFSACSVQRIDLPS